MLITKQGESFNANQAYCTLLGYSREEILSLSYDSLIHPDDREKQQSLNRQLFDGEIDHFSLEMRCVHKSGDIIHVFNTVSVLNIAEAEAAYFIAQLVDITARNRLDAALQKSEERLQRAQRIGQLGFWEWDIVKDELLWSDELYVLSALKPELFEPNYGSLLGLIHPDDRNDFQESFKAAIQNDTTYQSNHRVVLPDGQIRHHLTHAEIIRDEQGAAVRMFGTVMDITAIKQAEQEMRDSHQLLSAVIDAATDMIYVKDIDSQYVLVNTAAADYLGRSMTEIIGKSNDELFPPEKARQYNKEDKEVIATGRPKSYEHTMEVNGRKLTRLTTKTVYNDRMGKVLGIVGISHDISERKQAEDTLKESQSRLLEAQRMAHLGFWERDLVTDKMSLSDELFTIYGISEDEFAGNREAFMNLIHLEDKDYVMQAVNKAITDSSNFKFSHRIIRPDGEVRYVQSQGETSSDASGKVVHMFGISMDITEQKLAEQALTNSEQQLRSYYDADLVGMGLSNPDKGMFQVNDRFCQIIGYTREELQSMNWEALTHPDDLPDDIKQFNRLIAGDIDGYSIDKRCIRKDGQIITITLSSKCIRKTDATVDYIVTFMQDITEQKKVEQALKESEERFELAVTGSSDGLWDWDISTGKEWWSPRFYALLGYEDHAFDPTYEQFKDILHPQDKDRVFEVVRAHLEEHEPYDVECRLQLKNGDYRWFHTRGQAVRDEHGQPVRMAGSVQDITEQKNAEEALKESEDRFRGAFDNAALAMSINDLTGKYIRVNRAMCDFTGYSEDELLGMDWQVITYAEDMQKALTFARQLQNSEIDNYSIEKRYQHKSGEVIWGLLSIAPLHDAAGKITHVIAQVQDITEARQLSEQLSYQATHDALTGLVNRMEFEHRLGRVLGTVHATGTEHALAYLDLDQFKIINDTCGHIAGDKLLRQLGDLLSSKVRHRDTLARLGGDEFGVLMENCTLQNALRVANSLREAVEHYQFVSEGKRFNIGVSIGLVALSTDSGDITEVLKQADSACYAAKESGRNRIHIYNEEDEELARRQGEIQWVTQLARALEEDRFELSFQYIVPVNNKNRHGVHYEILLRLRDENGRIIMPGAFLPAAERYGLSKQIDRWVIQTTLSWLARHPEHMINELHMCSINLSGHSLGDYELLTFINHQLSESGVPPEKVCFEITETTAVGNLAMATEFINTLKDRGCNFALDDFGSGLSSFAYLKTLPVDALKIDGVFVKDIADDPIAFAMVKSINEIAHIMGKYTIAEFVESEAILEKLREIGVDYAQGYHISKPQPLETML